MKGEKRVAAAMLVAELANAEELCGVLGEVKVVFRLRQNSKGRGRVLRLCFLIWR